MHRETSIRSGNRGSFYQSQCCWLLSERVLVMTTIRMRLRACGFLAVVILSACDSALAHPVSLTDATIDVRSTETHVEIQVLVEELTLHYPIAASGDGVFPAEDLRQYARSHAGFLKKDLLLLDGEGRRLKCVATQVETAAIPDEGVPQTELKKLTVRYQFQYDSVGKSGFLTVSQKFGGPNAILPSIMDCMVLQAGVLAEAPAQLLAKQTFTVKIDWESPPTPPKNWRDLRIRRKKQLQERLGIASYGGLFSFLYVTAQEVRHEVLIPLLTLESWVKLDRRDPDFLEVSEQGSARKRIERFLTQRNPVTIDGKPVKAMVDRISFFGLDIRDFAVNAKPRKVGVYQGRVGIILSYPVPVLTTERGPRRITLKWETFNRHAEFLRSVVYIHDRDPVERFLRPDADTFAWNASSHKEGETLPVAKPVAAVARRAVVKAEAEKIATEILRNVYRAFEYRDEEATYDALATSVDGRLLRTLYLQIRKSLLMAGQGNARSRIREVQPVSSVLRKADEQQFELELTWNTHGEIEHWGHIHSRENQYRARLTVIARDREWKLIECRILGQKPLSFQTTLRKKAER